MVNLTPPSWQERKNKSLDHAFKMFGLIGEADDFQAARDPKFDYLKKAEQLAFQANKLRMQAATTRAKNANISVANLPMNMNAPKGGFGRFLAAISGQESGGNYSAVNSDSGAAGKYQIMPSNFVGSGGWDQEALGRDITLQQYLNNPRLQERIARHKLRSYYNQYGPAGAASAWYSGSPNNFNSQTSQGAYPSVHQYVIEVLRKAGLL